jgi:hypothetical protein
MSKSERLARQGIVDWYAQRDAADRKALAEIASRYRMQPAATTDELLAAMEPADADTVREILSHQLLSPEAAGFDLEQIRELGETFRRPAGTGGA